MTNRMKIYLSRNGRYLGLSVLIVILASMFSGIDQIIRLDREELSWLPMWFFTWDTGFRWPYPMDAWHTYQGAVHWLLSLGVFLLRRDWFYLPLYVMIFWWIRDLFLHHLLV